MARITIDASKCVGCGDCVRVCPATIFKLEKGKAEPIKEKAADCLECHACEILCPKGVITIG